MKIAKLALAISVTSLVFAGGARADDTLWQDLGGVDAIHKIASDTADNFLADPRIKATFDNTNMDRFRILLGDQFCVVAGGPCTYTGRNMKDTHKGLHLGNADFNAVVEDLEKAMDKNGVAYATQSRFLARLAPMQHDIVTK
ncbi:MAG TPA: group 1 truncated hemoglobin [Rhizomicrobium sp.]|nr:group 1 truncated hemoglobin [Rhizomicrobium sp.]